MRRLFLLLIGMVNFVLQSTECGAQQLPIPVRNQSQLTEDVRQAANVARMTWDDELVRAFTKSAQQQPRAFSETYNSVTPEARVRNMADYLTAKTGSKYASYSNLKDFHWGYVEQGFKFYPAKLEAPSDYKIRLRSVEVAGFKYEFPRESESTEELKTIVLPSPRSRIEYVTISFDLGRTRAFWTGLADAGIVDVLGSSTSAGCEIHVTSTPTGASVYFNGNEWHRKTDTKSVRDPNEWEVLVHLDGYRDWREKRKLGPGESWVIKAILKK